MNNIALIGVGNVSKNYLKGLNMSQYNLVCVIDVLNEPAGIKNFKNYPIYKSITEAQNNHKIDYVLISTPPITHEKLVMEALNLNVNVLVEKLVTLNNKNYNNITSLADVKALKLITLYHWQHGNESYQVNNYLNENINSITTKIYETYCNNNNTLKKEYYSLGGAIIDSLPNVLSFYALFLNLDKLTFIKRIDTKDLKTETIIKTLIKYNYFNAEINVLIDWTKNKNYKTTKITLDNNETILVDHSKEVIKTMNNKNDFSTKNRLETHYLNLFTKLNVEKYNFKNMENIHKLLFEQIK